APKPVLLTVSGKIQPGLAEEVARGERPRVDFLELAKAFDADLIDYAEAGRATGWFGALLAQLGGPNLLLAWACFRRRGRYAVIFTDGEQVGIPLATLERFLGFARGRRPAHLMLTHGMQAPKK